MIEFIVFTFKKNLSMYGKTQFADIEMNPERRSREAPVAFTKNAKPGQIRQILPVSVISANIAHRYYINLDILQEYILLF
jgi:hypothetical protein